ncbi:MAG: glycine/betaine ABC transporter [Actinobacteria bacterium]|nr:glycine/betaine ABC transporter [Actinomycetota bacterium]
MNLSRRGFAALAGLTALSACSTSNPLASPSSGGAATGSTSGPLVVGSQQYYSNEIIAELYAQVLEKAGLKVTRQYQIGQREVYLPEVVKGSIDVFPEYNGNLLQYLNKSASVTDTASVQAALSKALPPGLRVLAPADASDQDTYTTTQAFSSQYGVTSLADLSKVTKKLTVAANSEFATRPYGPSGLKTAYGVDVTVVPVEDSGGPLTVKALTDGKADFADIYSASPSIVANNLVVLKDPKNLILPQNVVPLVSAKVNATAADAITKVNAQLSADDLRKLNAQSVNEQKKSADIAKAWLSSKGLI